MSDIQFSVGTPTLDLFRDGSRSGPLVIDRVAAAGYYVDPVTGLVTALGGGGGTYTNANPSTITVGGLSAGTTFAAQTLTQLFDAMLYPYQSPAFTAYSISGVSSLMEVGSSFGPGPLTFNWSTSNSGNVAVNSITLSDTTLSTTIASGLANSGSSSQTLGAAVTRTSAGNHVFGISGTNTHAAGFSGSLTLSWQWLMYYGPSTNVTLTAAQILALASSALATSYVGTFVETAAGFKYICLADAAGSQINSVKDQSTGFNVPMATSTDNAAYSNTDGGGFSYALVSVANAHSVTTNVRVYRSKNNLGGAVTLLVT